MKHKKKSKKIEKVMREFKHGKLHSGSPKGPKVTNEKQAIAIALSEARKIGKHMHAMPRKKKKKKSSHDDMHHVMIR